MQKSNHIKSARRTLDIESKELLKLSNTIGKDFSNLCDYLLDCEGHIITIGVGKSGHVANKVSATLSSTGSPSYFIHAGEALHGDIGAITDRDAVLIFSYSGESQEIISILPSLKEIGCSIFSITGRNDSSIALNAKLNISTEVDKEACPLNLAPTSSTTASLALGDALAIALLEARKFSPEDFAKSHPGGKLGKKLLLKVKDLMHEGKNFPTVNPSTPISEALLEVTDKGLGIAVVIDNSKRLKGVFTDGDLRRCLQTKLDIHKTKISSVMSTNVKTIRDSSLAIKATEVMQENEIYVLVVINQKNKPVGVLRMHDLMQSGLV